MWMELFGWTAEFVVKSEVSLPPVRLDELLLVVALAVILVAYHSHFQHYVRNRQSIRIGAFSPDGCPSEKFRPHWSVRGYVNCSLRAD